MERITSAVTALLHPTLAFGGALILDQRERAILDGYPDCVKILSTSGDVLHMNKMGCEALGIDAQSGFGMPWVPLLSPSIHQDANAALATAACGTVARFLGVSGDAVAPVYWDNLLTPVVDDHNLVEVILCVSRNVTEQMSLKRQLESSLERENLLTQEMRHRVKNLFSVVSGLIVMTERGFGEPVDSSLFASVLRERLIALGKASEVAFVHHDTYAGIAAKADLREIVTAVLSPYTDRVIINGTDVNICANTVTTLALIVHELATNAVKYGALRTGGETSLSFEQTATSVVIVWRERGANIVQVSDIQPGIGTTVIARSARSIGGTVEYDWLPDGLNITLVFPQ